MIAAHTVNPTSTVHRLSFRRWFMRRRNFQLSFGYPHTIYAPRIQAQVFFLGTAQSLKQGPRRSTLRTRKLGTKGHRLSAAHRKAWTHERIVAVPSLWPRSGGVLQQHWLGFSRHVDSEQANFRVARHQLILHVSGSGHLTPKYQIGFVASDRISNRHAKSA